MVSSKLFSGVFLKVLALCKLHFKDAKTINIKVISDTIDHTIIKRFKKDIDELINILTQKKLVKELKKYDSKSKQLLKSELITNIEFEDNQILFDSINYEITTEVSSITLIADILSNTTFYYLKQELKLNSNIQLNSEKSMLKHPLSSLLFGCHNKEVLPLSDIVYRRVRTK